MPQINDNAQKFTDERLEQNYKMSIDPDAEPGLKPSAEEPMIYRSEALEQNYNMSMNPNSEPGLKPIEEGHHKTR